MRDLSQRYSWRELGIFLAFIALAIVMTVVSDGRFIQPRNVMNIAKQASINGILAMGLLLVILSGGIDLSVGSILAVSGVVAAMFAHPGEYSLATPIVLSCLVGLFLGLVNGLFIAYGRVASFIVTLGMMTMARGLALILSGGSPVFNVSAEFENIAGGFILGIPSLAVYFIVIAALGAFVLTKTIFGRHVYAIGGNEMSARVSGINVEAVKVAVYAASGLLAGLAGMLLASRIVSGSPTSGAGYELDAITAVIIGGVSMSGGSGRWYGAVIGALFIAVMGNGLDLIGVQSHYQLVIKGAIIILAVLFDTRAKGSA